MVKWTGKGDMHITFMPRKPTDCGFKIDTMACADSMIVLQAEVDEGAARMADAKYRDQVAPHTAVTMRLVDEYANTDRTVIADSRFGSCNTAEWLYDVFGFHSILAVKTASAGFPKKRLREQLGERRGSHCCMKVDVKLESGTTTFYASGLLDKKPMYVVATCGTTIVTEVAARKSMSTPAGVVEYEVPFPEMHALYRRYFNAVDLFNRTCFGP